MAVSDQRIREAALKVWNDQGLAHTTMKRIGETAQIGEPALHRRFGSRDQLVQSAFEEAAKELCEQLESTDDIGADLILLAEVFRTLLRRRGRVVLDLVLEGSRREDAAAMLPAAVEVMHRAAAIIARHQAAGLLRGDNAWEPLLALFGPLFLPVVQRDPQQRSPQSPSVNVDEFLRGWAVPEDALTQRTARKRS